MFNNRHTDGTTDFSKKMPTIDQNCEKAIKKWLETLMSSGDHLVKNGDKQITMSS